MQAPRPGPTIGRRAVAEPAVASVRHALAGRTRIGIDARRGDAAFFAALAEELSGLPGVRSVEVHPLTGSALIRHDGAFSRIALSAGEAGLFTVEVQPAATVTGKGERETPQGTHRAKAAPAASDPEAAMGLNGRHLLAVIFLALAIVQVLRGRLLSPALTLAWYAVTMLKRDRAPLVD
jgi:hypothetical protein